MMSERRRRRRYLIHPSSQFRYILMSVLPALIMTIFCTFFLIKSGEVIIRMEKERATQDIGSLNQTITQFKNAQSFTTEIKTLEILKKQLDILEENMKIRHFMYREQWAKAKIQMLAVLFIIMIIVRYWLLVRLYLSLRS